MLRTNREIEIDKAKRELLICLEQNGRIERGTSELVVVMAAYIICKIVSGETTYDETMSDQELIYSMDGISGSLRNTLLEVFEKKCYQEAEKILFQASELSDFDITSRIARTCIAIMKATNWCLDEKYSSVDNVGLYQEHGGINLAPIDKNKGSIRTVDGCEKIGRHVQSVMEQLIQKGTIDEKMIRNLTSPSWSKDVLHLAYPLLRWVDTAKPVKEQLKDSNGYTRYWVKPYIIEGEQYCICKEWYESGRKHFDKWIDSLKTWKKGELKIDASVLLELLKYIKTTDQKQTCISRQELFEEMNAVKEKEALLSQMISMGLLSAFQGTERELVVDDYDLLFDMIRYPNDYIV